MTSRSPRSLCARLGQHARSSALPALLGVGATALGGGLASPVRAQATDPECSSLPAPILYGRGGSASNIYVGNLAVALADSSKPLTVVYKDDGACFAMASLGNGEKLTATAKYFTRQTVDGKTSVVAKTCTLSADVAASWGAMAQQASTCPGFDELPANVSDAVGPVSGFSFVVPRKSQQQVVSAEAIYYIYGLDQANPDNRVKPWTVPEAIATRLTTSAAGLLVAKAVGIPLSHTLEGVDGASQKGVVEWITSKGPAAVANPEAAIGFVSSEYADTVRDITRPLAFQAFGQEYGYWPDSDANSFDKINLRQGRYFLWNPHHFYAKLADGKIADADTKRWIGYLTGSTPLPDDLSILDIQIDSGVVPDCAMQVTRDGDVGPLASYQPDESCNCYFEARVTGHTPASCQECTGEGPDASCPESAPNCHHGFCEVK